MAKTAQARLTSARDHTIRAALAVSLAVPLTFLVGALGTRFGWWDYKVGLLGITSKAGVTLAWTALVVGLAAFYGALVTTPRKHLILAAAALAIPIAALGTLGSIRSGAGKVPPIHDISTDVLNPPAFSAETIAARGPNANSVDFASKRVPTDPRFGPASGQLSRDLQAKAYPKIKTMEVSGAQASIFPIARAAMVRQGVAITSEDPSAGIIEGVHTSFWFGFKDDVVVRLTLAPSGRTLVDVRSSSRVGVSDLGANAKRIAGILNQIEVATFRQTGDKPA
jgi:Protein of unknown function (DUF1499)